jgi:hypothetical protein
MVLSVGHKGELAEEGQPVFQWLMQFQFVRLAHVTVICPVAHCKAENIFVRLGFLLYIYVVSPNKRRILFIYFHK